MKSKIKSLYFFLGRWTALFGVMSVVAGFIIFVFDMIFAFLLQRFLIATFLVEAGGPPPFGIPVYSALTEASFLIVASFARAAALWANSYVTGLCNTSFESGKRNEIVAWSLSSGRESLGRVMTLFNDVTIGSAATISNIFYFFSRIVLICGLFLALLSYSVALTVFVVSAIIAIVPVQRWIDAVLRKNSRNIQQELAVSVDRLTTDIKNNLFITLHDLVGPETERLQKSIRGYTLSYNIYYSLSSLRSILPQTIGMIVVCLITLYGSEIFSDNRSHFVAYVYLVLRFFQMLSDLARVSGNMSLNAPRLKVLWVWWCDHIEQKPHIVTAVDIAATGPVGWLARDLTFRWSDDVATCIQGLNFSILPGQIVHISGVSGAGKTTLMYLLLGLMPARSGELRWTTAGQTWPLTGRLPVCIAYVGPEPFLQSGSVRDQLMAGQNREIDDIELWGALQSARAGFVRDMQGGLDYHLTEQGIGLSAGQKQRLVLARALLRHPSVLLLDEATANLDPETERDVLEAIKTLRGNVTIIMIAHRPHPVLAPDQIITLGPVT